MPIAGKVASHAMKYPTEQMMEKLRIVKNLPKHPSAITAPKIGAT